MALLFSPPSAGRYSLSFEGPAVLDAGPTKFTATEWQLLTEHDIGRAIENPIRCITSAAGVNFAVVEVQAIE